MENRYFINPNAESICNVVAIVFLIVSIICALFCLLAGLASDAIVYGILGAVIFVIAGLVSWASLKVVVNISRSLYNITDALRAGLKQNGASSISGNINSNNNGVDDSAIQEESKPHFSVGQLVIVKATEEQFRITSIDDNGYYSEKYDKIFTDDEIEDFNVYWACKD